MIQPSASTEEQVMTSWQGTIKYDDYWILGSNVFKNKKIIS